MLRYNVHPHFGETQLTFCTVCCLTNLFKILQKRNLNMECHQNQNGKIAISVIRIVIMDMVTNNLYTVWSNL